jgi:hypothetical protein
MALPVSKALGPPEDIAAASLHQRPMTHSLWPRFKAHASRVMLDHNSTLLFAVMNKDST